MYTCKHTVVAWFVIAAVHMYIITVYMEMALRLKVVQLHTCMCREADMESVLNHHHSVKYMYMIA